MKEFKDMVNFNLSKKKVGVFLLESYSANFQRFGVRNRTLQTSASGHGLLPTNQMLPWLRPMQPLMVLQRQRREQHHASE